MNRAELIRLLEDYKTKLYGMTGCVEFDVEELNSVENVLRSIIDKPERYTPSVKNAMSDETKKRISIARTGYKVPEEVKERMRQNARRFNVFQYDKETMTLISAWRSTCEVERVLGYNNSLISKCCRGKKPSAYGYVWKYKPIGEPDDMKVKISVKEIITSNAATETTAL